MGNTDFSQRCRFATDRLSVGSWRDAIATAESRHEFAVALAGILTPAVTRTIPPALAAIGSSDDALRWIAGTEHGEDEGEVFTIRLAATDEIIGLLLLHLGEGDGGLSLHLGYFLAESTWGQGLGSELIAGLVDWCQKDGGVREIVGFVEPDNLASAKVLVRGGFQSSERSDDRGMLRFARTF